MPVDRIVITGAGILACNGIGLPAFWDALRNGRSGVGHITRFDTSPFPCHIGGQLWDFNPEDFLSKADVKRWHSHVHQSVACAKLAYDDSEFAKARYAPERVAVGFGTSVGAPDEHYLRYRETFESHGWDKIDKFASSASSGHAATANVSTTFKFRGPATTIASGCATGLDVLQWGVEQIRYGHADAAIVGASESPLTPLTMAVSCSLNIVSKRNDDPTKAMRPFDKHSDGIVLAEGAGALILERESNARARGAKLYGEFAGYAAAAEGNNPLVIDKEGKALARAIENALRGAGMNAQELDAAVCHGVSLPMYDRSESNAYKRALGDHAYHIPITAPKSMTGQPYAAGGLIGLGAALMCLDHGIISPTINLSEPDPDCDLDYVPNHSRMNDVRSIIVTAMSFGGTHSGVVLRKCA
ncbi:MAG: beta-ketoacyl-[acyl-carrier-protein] synthase family protein [Candidatus Hydrogenedentes bacterium]|nr:beta-ketoacyl-[acyl-carrier-protein] synthase family protein [Candidatus Hydrogenedentota bacterium]